MTPDYDLLVLAEVNPDVVVACPAGPVEFGQVEQLVDAAAITLGSSGAITASAAAAQGLRVALCGVVGDDDLGDLTTRLLADRGVDVSGVVRRPGKRTGMTVVLSRPDGDRALLTFPGTMGDLNADDVGPARLARARHVHVSSYYLQTGIQPHLPDLFAEAGRQGASTSLDPGWDPTESWSSLAPALRAVDYLLPNRAECVAIAAALGRSAADPCQAAVALSSFGPTVAVKLGADGALAATADGVVDVRAAAAPIIDTTGAGDNFDAGFLAGLLDGQDLPAALARGVGSGTVALGGLGGTGRMADRDEAIAAAAALLTPVSPHDQVQERP